MANGTGLIHENRLCSQCGQNHSYALHEWCPPCVQGWDRARRGVEVRESQCEMCGETFSTTDTRKRFCDRKCKSLFRRFSAYGITPVEYERLLEKQNGGCAICTTAASNVRGHRLSVDHDHLTGEVRGLLCSACNSGIGHFRDNPLFMERAITYLSEGGNS